MRRGFCPVRGAVRECQAVFGLEALTLQGHTTMSECVMMCRKDNARSTYDGTRPACHHDVLQLDRQGTTSPANEVQEQTDS